MAYFGPNAEIIPSVKLKMWHNQNAIEDFNDFAFNIILLFVVDFMSFIINGLLIWKSTGINTLFVLCNIQERYWFVMTMAEATVVSAVSFSYKEFILQNSISSLLSYVNS